MTGDNLFYYSYASFTNTQLPLLKVATLSFDKLVNLDPIGASRDNVGTDRHREISARSCVPTKVLATSGEVTSR
jgi:hypothetical protein